MSIRLIDGSEFLHLPKTGGTWVASILKSNNLFLESYAHEHADYDFNLFQPSSALSGRQHLSKAFQLLQNRIHPKKEFNQKIPFRFCFVRNPLAWYESWWRYMQGRGWNDWGEVNSAIRWHPNSTLNKLGSDDFNEFIWNVIKERPGYVSELFFSFTKPGISFIGRTETLREDLFHVLTTLGLDIEKKALFNKPKLNESKTPALMVEWDPKLKKIVTKLELPALIHFGYLNEKERMDLGVDANIPPNKALHIHTNIENRNPELS